MIDGFSHYSVVTVVECKKSIVILENLAIGWFMRVGTPVSILHDLGGEFNNDLFMLLMSTFGCLVKITADYAPMKWSRDTMGSLKEY